MTENYLLEVKNVSKSFGVVKALNRIDFNVRPNEIHALCGENGAGKSTLMNILSGVYPYGSYGGEVYYDGELCKFRNVRESEKKNIAIIHQHLALFPALSIAENIFLGNENAKNSVIDWKLTIRRAAELMERVGLHENPETKIRDLGVGKQQLVEICKAISKNVRLLILDEPTAALNDEESALLLELMRKFRQEGISCIFITHKLHEITAVADRITIIRDGETIETLSMHGDQVNEDRIIKGMVGREMKNRFPARENHVAEKCFEVRNWTVYQPTDETRKRIDNVSFYAKKGEVLGIAGLMGAGRTELAMSIFGRSYGTKISGTLIKDGKEITCPTVAQAIANSIGYVSEDRHRYGCIGGQSIKDTRIDAVMCNNDAIALGVLASLKNVGYGTAEKPFPVITGMDCDIANIKAIKSGEISMTVFKDNRIIAKKAAEVMDCVLHDKTPQAGDAFETTFNNGVCDVTAFLIAPEVIDKDNYQAALFDSGYYSEDQLK